MSGVDAGRYRRGGIARSWTGQCMRRSRLPTRVVPPVVAVIASALALLVGYAARIEPTDNVLRDVDWKTLMSLGCIFCLVRAVVKTELLSLLALRLYAVFGTALMPVALTMIAGIGVLSSVLANVPVAAASTLIVKGSWWQRRWCRTRRSASASSTGHRPSFQCSSG
ncbi:hypothetical protein SB861_39150 [Paraburkholderia sp. SIMBA_049]